MKANVKDLFNVSSLSFSMSLSSFVCWHDVEVQSQSQNVFMHSVQRRLWAFVCVCLFLCLFCVFSSRHQNGFMHSLQRRDGFIRSRPQDPSPLNKLHCTALQWNYYCMKLTTSQWKRARDQSLLDVAQCNFYCKEQNKARWKRAQVYGTNKSTALQEVHVYAYMYIYTCGCGCFCTCVPACVRTACLKRALRWWPSSRQMDHEALGKNLMSCLWPSPRQVHEG